VAELDAQETLWWRNFAKIEADFCWVQTPEIQRIIRWHYIRRIVAALPPDARILDLGCGTGWLSRLLADAGARSVLGIDFSEAQINLARAETEKTGLGGKVAFQQISGAGSFQPETRFDAVVAHAFLHHLSTEEIRGVIGQAASYLPAGGRLFLLEPSSYPGQAGSVAFKVIDWFVERLGNPAHPEGKLRRVPVSEAERRWRQQLQSRLWGVGGRGPAPKEIPFMGDELRQLVMDKFQVIRRVPVLIRAHLIAQEWLLRSQSGPVSPWFLKNLLRLVSRLDRLAAAAGPEGGRWIFELWECAKRR
jgi:SAM-dependent methyltransferase